VLARGEAIHPFSDMTLAPVPLSLVMEIISKVAAGYNTGIFQLSADLDVPYSAIAQQLADHIGADPDLVQPVNAAEAGLFEETISPYTSLDCTVTRDQLQVELPSIWKTIDWAIQILSSKA